jgi:hypothetical protein
MPSNDTIAQAMTTDGKAKCPSDTSFASSTTETQFTKGGTLLALYLPGSDKVKNKPIRIKAWGRVTGNTTTNFTAQVYSGTSTTIGSNTSIATTGAKAVNSTKGSWMLVIEGVWDADSKMLMGNMYGHVAGTTVAQAIISSVATPNKDTTTEGLGLTVTGAFSASDAGNKAYLDGFELNPD